MGGGFVVGLLFEKKNFRVFGEWCGGAVEGGNVLLSTNSKHINFKRTDERNISSERYIYIHMNQKT